MNRLNIRWRLTAWYGAVLLLILASFSTAVYFIMQRALAAHLDDALAEELSEMARETEHASDWDGLRTELRRQFSSHEGYEFQVATLVGAVRFRSEGLAKVGLSIPRPRKLPSKQSRWLGSLGEWRVESRQVAGPDGLLVIQAAASVAPIKSQMRGLLAVFGLAGPLALAGALAGGYVMARRALAPVDRMVATAENISGTRLDHRLDVPPTGDELARLARTLNGMLDRIARSFRDIRRFSADAAHELRTPLAVIRTEAEVALRSPRANEQYRDALAAILEETDRLTQLTEQLLFLCRIDAGRSFQRREPVLIARLVQDVADSLRALAAAKGVSIETHCQNDGVVMGDDGQLRRLLLNLLDNALKYTPVGGSVTARIERQGARIAAVVEDTGIGISAEQLPHVCERFYRVDPSRDHAVEGTGLGLAICQAIAASHGAELRIESNEGRGTRCIFSMADAGGRRVERHAMTLGVA